LTGRAAIAVCPARAPYPRHCERSEAIHSAVRDEGGLLRYARNDGGEIVHATEGTCSL